MRYSLNYLSFSPYLVFFFLFRSMIVHQITHRNSHIYAFLKRTCFCKDMTRPSSGTQSILYSSLFFCDIFLINCCSVEYFYVQSLLSVCPMRKKKTFFVFVFRAKLIIVNQCNPHVQIQFIVRSLN